MPPKPKYTREEIIDAAYDLACEKDLDAVVARALGKQLNTSVSPIFTLFSGMDEVKAEVINKAKIKYKEYMEDIFEYRPAFKEFGMRNIRFSAQNPNLYRLLFLRKDMDYNPYDALMEDFGDLYDDIIEEIEKSFGISTDGSKKLLKNLIIYSNGLLTYNLSSILNYTEDEISANISEVCAGLVSVIKLREDTFDLDMAKELAEISKKGITPEKITR